MKVLYVFTFIFCIGCRSKFNIEKTENQLEDLARIELREILGNLNCQSPILKKDCLFKKQLENDDGNEYYFRKIVGDSIYFDYKMKHPSITRHDNKIKIDSGKIKLKCLNFQSPKVDEIRELVDRMLYSNVTLDVWGNNDTIEALPNFIEDGRSFGKYTMLNQLENILSIQEINDLKNNGLHYSSHQLKNLNLTFFNDKNVYWLNQQQAEDTGFYLKMYTPLFNTNKTLCFLHYDLVCNRIAECSSGIHLIFKKEKNHWKRIYVGGWES